MSTVLCVGTLIIDIINEKLDRLPNPGECIGADVSLYLGGNAYSSSVNIKRLAPKNTSVFCYGNIGADGYGSLFENAFAQEGVISKISKVPSQKISCNIILQEKGLDRRYIFNEGANAGATKQDLLKTINDVQPDIIVFGEMPTLGIVGDDFLEIAKHAKYNYNSLIALDLLVTEKEEYQWLYGNWALLDIIHCNFGEGQHITKQSEPIEMCRWFLDNGVLLPLVTHGAHGCYYGHRKSIQHIPAFKIEEIDATGAGDALLAGIVRGLLNLIDKNAIDTIEADALDKIVTYGVACGAIAARAFGCIGNISPEIVEGLIGNII